MSPTAQHGSPVGTIARITHNPLRGPVEIAPIDPKVTAFHARMPASSPTMLFDVPELAAQLGVARLLVKAETRRMGLPSFKILGASWATYRAICEHIGYEPEPWRNINELAKNLEHLKPFQLATATDGNHGRAVAFMARLLGFSCHIYVPRGMVEARIQAIRSEGALVTVVDGTYDEAVARSAQEASDRCLVVSDTSWEGYETTPARVIEGYSTIFHEVDEAIDASGLQRPDIVVIPMGVGAFMAAGVSHYRADTGGDRDTLIVGVEPLDANCVQMSAIAGEITSVPGPHHSIMVGLNCGMPSLTAWPRLSKGIDWFASVDDEAACQAMRDLAEVGIVAGETGAAGLAGFEALIRDDDVRAHVDGSRLADATVLVVVTEGATDPEHYRLVVGRGHETIGRVITAVRA
jgi:diaminopropionate ammonia-lyase